MNSRNDETLTQMNIFLFWVPLAVMWIIMGIEQPAINAVIARLPDPKANLAAFGVTFALSLLIEGPIIQLLTAGTALSHNLQNYKRLLAFMHIMAVGLTGIHLLIGLTPLFQIITRNILGIPEDLIGLSRGGFLSMFPFSAAVGYRRLWQGVLIRYGRTNVIPITMVIRISVTAAFLSIGMLFPTILPGASVGGLSLSAGVISGALAALFSVRKLKKEGKIKEAGPDEEVVSWRGLFVFYIPLALTSFITLAIRPVVTAGIARAQNPVESLAVWPVIHSFLFLFTSISLSYQEVVVARLKEEKDYKPLNRFTWRISLVILGIFVLVPFVSFDTIWFKYIAGLPEDLLSFVRTPIRILPLMPFFLSHITWFRGVQVRRRNTMNITKGVGINAGVIILFLFPATALIPLPGVIIAATAIVFSNGMESLFLWIKTRQQNRTR